MIGGKLELTGNDHVVDRYLYCEAMENIPLCIFRVIPVYDDKYIVPCINTTVAGCIYKNV